MKNKFFKKFISLIIVGVLLFSFWPNPAPVSATVSSTVMGTGSCVAGGYFASLIQSRIQGYEDMLQNWITSHIGDWGSSQGSSQLNMSSVPVNDTNTQSQIKSQAQAGRTNDNNFNLQAQIQRCLARELLNQGSTSIMNIIRTSGRDGGAAFVRNWRNLLTGAEYRGEDIFRAELSTANVCSYMRSGVNQAFNITRRTPLTNVNTRTGSLSNFSSTAGCTLPSNFNMTSYLQNPQANGGWQAFIRLSEPQNNPLGMAMLANQELLNQRSLETQSDTAQAIAGAGYLGISGTGASDSCLVKAATGRCIVYKDIKTTGSYLKDNALITAQAELTWLTSTGTIGDLITAGIDLLVNRLSNEADTTPEHYYYTTSNATFSPSTSTGPTFSGTPTPSPLAPTPFPTYSPSPLFSTPTPTPTSNPTPTPSGTPLPD